MGLFGPDIKYSQHPHQLTEIELKKLLGHIHSAPGSSVGSSDENAVERAIMARRGGDGDISLQQVYEVLLQLKNQRALTIYDFTTLLKNFVEYWDTHYKE